jgi:hypothetical protein
VTTEVEGKGGARFFIATFPSGIFPTPLEPSISTGFCAEPPRDPATVDGFCMMDDEGAVFPVSVVTADVAGFLSSDTEVPGFSLAAVGVAVLVDPTPCCCCSAGRQKGAGPGAPEAAAAKAAPYSCHTLVD